MPSKKMLTKHTYALFVITTFTLIVSFPDISLAAQYPLEYNISPLTNSNHINTYQNAPIDKAITDVKSTIEEVQALLEKDTSLPRLTRGEIEDLFEQVTKEEYEKSIRSGDFSRAKHMRALMLVLPYNYNNDSNSSADLQELYNRPPITKVVSSETKAPKLQKVVVPTGKVEILSIENYKPTTYKPVFRRKQYNKYPNPTTYRPNTVYITPSTEKHHLTTENSNILESAKITTGRYRSHYRADKADFQKPPHTDVITSTTSKPQITEELEELLESLGFAGQSQSKKRFKLDDPPPDDLSKPIISSLIKQDSSNVHEFKPLPMSIYAEDFKKSLIPQIKPDDFIYFKPIQIPDDNQQNLNPELEDYFKMFGLVESNENRRSHKSLETSRTKKVISSMPDIDNTMVPSSFSNVLHNIGIPMKQSRIDENFFKPNKNTFDPTKLPTDENDLKQLESLLQTIRELQKLNVTLTEEMLQKLDLNNFNLSETLLAQQGPNPIDETENDQIKNEIKRQTESPEPTRFNLNLNLEDLNDTLESNSSLTEDLPINDSVTITSTNENEGFTESGITERVIDVENFSETSTTTTTTEESRSADISELGDSFAGGLDPVTEEPLPPPRRNGFYFLADWNSFLEVGEDPDKVVVRFDPKIGDPSRFIPVNVP